MVASHEQTPDRVSAWRALRVYLEHQRAMGLEWLPWSNRGMETRETLEEVQRDLGDCTRCRLHQGRTKIVFGEGNPEASLVLVGEGPGRDEDLQGRPFVGAAGRLLERIIAAKGWQRPEIYICNVVKCRPPGNRAPQEDEIKACTPFLRRQLLAIRPRAILALGAVAATFLVGRNQPVASLRGNVHNHEGIPVVVTYHPAYLLRNPLQKRRVWEDLNLLVRVLEKQQ